MAEENHIIPPVSWFTAVADGRRQYVAFRDTRGETELVESVWEEENVFRVVQLPLRIDGVSRDDYVEVGWNEADPTPHFTRVIERSGYRTVRVMATDREVKALLGRRTDPFLGLILRRSRYEQGVLVFCVEDAELKELAEYDIELRDFLPGDWRFTDRE